MIIYEHLTLSYTFLFGFLCFTSINAGTTSPTTRSSWQPCPSAPSCAAPAPPRARPCASPFIPSSRPSRCALRRLFPVGQMWGCAVLRGLQGGIVFWCFLWLLAYSGLLNESLGMYCCQLFHVWICLVFLFGVVRLPVHTGGDFPPLQMSILDCYIKGMYDMRNHSQFFLHTKLVT